MEQKCKRYFRQKCNGRLVKGKDVRNVTSLIRRRVVRNTHIRVRYIRTYNDEIPVVKSLDDFGFLFRKKFYRTEREMT